MNIVLKVAAILAQFGARQGVVRRLNDDHTIMVVHDGDVAKYPGLESLRAYAQDYTWVEQVLRPCGSSRNLFFRKQCMVLKVLQTLPLGSWLFVSDADVAVVHSRPLSSFTRGITTDVILYERFHNNEICAGLYFVRHTVAGVAFMKKWISMERFGGANADNGALIAMLANNAECHDEWLNTGRQGYFHFVSTCKRAMGLLDCSPFGTPRVVGGATVLRRGHGMALDFFIMGEGHGPLEDQGGVAWPWAFLIHGVKRGGHRLRGQITAAGIKMPIVLQHDDAVALMRRRDRERRQVHTACFVHCSSTE